MNTKRNRSAFTLVEIMIVVAIIGLLAVIAVPGFIRSPQLSQGRALINDARQIDAAIDQWALENGKVNGNAVDSASVAAYLKDGTLKSKVNALGSTSGSVADILTVNSITLGVVGATQTQITTSAKN